MVNRSTSRSTSNAPGEIPQSTPSGEGQPNTVKRNDGPVKPTDTTPTSEPLAEQPEAPPLDRAKAAS